jgi:hypothetical protein
MEIDTIEIVEICTEAAAVTVSGTAKGAIETGI